MREGVVNGRGGVGLAMVGMLANILVGGKAWCLDGPSEVNREN